MKFKLKSPILCLVVGVPGSGKSGLAEKIAELLRDAAFISKDLVQTPFTSTERVSGETYSMIRGPAFRILVDFSEKQLSLGKTPVVDAPFSVNHWRKDEFSDWVSPFKETAQKYSARFAIIRCLPPSAEELKRRIKARNYEWDRWKLENWDEFIKREPPDFPIKHDDVYELLSDRSAEKMAEDVLKNFLKAEPQPSIAQ